MVARKSGRRAIYVELMANEDKATRYHRLQRRASVLATLAGALLLVVLIVTGASAALRSAVITKIDFLPLSVTAYVMAVFFCYELVQLPFAYYQGVVLEQRYGLSTERPGHWWMNQGKAAALGVPVLDEAAFRALIMN